MSFASGCMDILSYRELGQVFTSAMTGNAALLGLDLGRGNIPATSRNMAAFASFLFGLGLGAALLRGHRAEAGRSRATILALLAEKVLLVAFAALWHHGAGPSSLRLLYRLIALSAVAMGVRAQPPTAAGCPASRPPTSRAPSPTSPSARPSAVRFPRPPRGQDARSDGPFTPFWPTSRAPLSQAFSNVNPGRCWRPFRLSGCQPCRPWRLRSWMRRSLLSRRG